MLSTPILTAIFGDGSLEVRGHSPRTPKEVVFKTCLEPGGGHRGLGLYRAWRNGGKHDKCEPLDSPFFPQEICEEVNSSDAHEVINGLKNFG